MRKQNLRILSFLIPLLVILVTLIVVYTFKRSEKENMVVELVQTSLVRINQLGSLENAVQLNVEKISSYARGRVRENIQLTGASINVVLHYLDSVKNAYKDDSDLQQDVDTLTDYVNKRASLISQFIFSSKEKKAKEDTAFFLNVPVYNYTNRVFASIRLLRQKTLLQLQKNEEANSKSIKQTRDILGLWRWLTLFVALWIARIFFLNFAMGKRMQHQLEEYNLKLEKDVAQKTSEIRQSEERYRTLIEQASEAIIISDINAKVLDVNDNACTMLGYSKEELCKMSIDDFVEYEDETQLRNVYELLAKGESILSERILKCNNGSLIFVESKSRKLSDGRIMSIVRDVTERKKLEEALKASEKNLKDVLSSSIDIFYAVDRNYRIILFNRVAEKLLSIAWGKPLSIGANILELICKPTNEPYKESFERAFKGEFVNYEMKNTVENLPLWVSVNYNPVKDDDGTVIGVSVITENISKRKKAEEELLHSIYRFELIAKTTNDAIWEWDFESGKGWANETHQQLYGLTLNDPVPGQERWLSRIHPDDRDKILKIQEQSLISPANIYSSEYRFDVEGKGYRNIFDRGYIVRGANGNAIRTMGSMMDITELKLAEVAIKESEEKFRNLVEQSLVGVYIIQDGKFAYINPKLAEMFGYQREEIINSIKATDLIHPDYRSVVAENIRLRIEGIKESINYETKAVKKNGESMLIELFGSRTEYMGRPAIIGTTIDITFRKKAEEEIQQSINRFELISRTTNDAIWEWDLNSDKLWANENHQQLYGLTISDPVPTHDMWIARIHPEDRSRIIDKQNLALASKINVFISEYRFNVAGKGYRYIYDRCYIERDNAGIATRMMGSLMDITELKKAEAEIKNAKELSDQVIDSLPGIFYLFNEQGNFLRWNKQFEVITCYNSHEIAAMKPWELFEGDEVEYIKERIEGVFLDGFNDAEAHIVTKQKRKIPFYFKAVRIDYENKNCLLGYGFDISARKKTEMELEDSLIAIRHLSAHLQNIREQERVSMAREIHDELGQQLTVLKMDASWLNKKLNTADPNVKEKLKDLIELLDATVKTVRRISSELRPSLLDDMGLVPAMEWHLKEFESRTSLKTKLSTPGEELNLPEGIKTGLFRIFQESLTNVARHANAKKVDINLKLENENIVLSIKDDGKGFEMDKVKEKKTLGILGMQERSYMIGGKYEVKSKPGKGTNIIVSVPYKEKK